jgi:Na+/H+ antiporter NhaC
MTPVVYQTVAAIAGGGVFGDHASPVSDTTVLASVGAGSDHMDHVITQLPYALLVAALTTGLYLLG